MTKVLVFSSCTPKDDHTHPTLEMTDLMNRRTKASITSRYLLWISTPKFWGTELTTTAKLLLMEMKSQSYQRRWWRGPSRRQRGRWRRRWWWRRWHRHPFRFLAPRSYQKYNQSLCPWGEGREEKEKWGEKRKGGTCLYTVSWRSAKFLAHSRLKTFILCCFRNYRTSSLIIVLWWQHSSKEQAHRSGQVPWIPNASMPARPALTVMPCLNPAHSPEMQLTGNHR